MDVSIKSFDVDMAIKNKGIELEIHEPGGKMLGDLVVTKTHLIWCPGKTKRENGRKIKWTDFIDLVDSAQQPKKSRKSAKKAVNQVAPAPAQE